MYTRIAKPPAYYARRHIEEMKKRLSLEVDDVTAKKLYEEWFLFLEIFNLCVEMSTYLLVLSLKATSKIDRRAHLHVNDDLVGYGRDAMQEILVIRLRELFQAEKDEPEKFRFNGFHQSLYEVGKAYPRPNLETNNAIARIIKRRNFYSAHHRDGKKEYSLIKNRLHTFDLITAVTYMAKVDDTLNARTVYDPFERLLNDELDVDRPLTLETVYEVVTGDDYERFINENAEVLETLPDGTQVIDSELEDTPEYVKYQTEAKKEILKIRNKVNKIIG